MHSSTLPPLPRGLKWGMVLMPLLFVVLVILNQPLQTGAAPQGMISFQLAGSAQQAAAILASWGDTGVNRAWAALLVDFIFIPVYLLTLLLLTTYLTADRPGIRERKVARWVRLLFVTAGVSDVAENVLLINNLETPTDAIGGAAAVCALVKFATLLLGAAGLVVIRAARRHPLSS